LVFRVDEFDRIKTAVEKRGNSSYIHCSRNPPSRGDAAPIFFTRKRGLKFDDPVPLKVGANALLAFIEYCQQDLERMKARKAELELANHALDRIAFQISTHNLPSPFRLDPQHEAALVDLGP
jgi:hypothetical protein